MSRHSTVWGSRGPSCPVSLEYYTRLSLELPPPWGSMRVRVLADYEAPGGCEVRQVRRVLSVREALSEGELELEGDIKGELQRRAPQEWLRLRREALEECRHQLMVELSDEREGERE